MTKLMLTPAAKTYAEFLAANIKKHRAKHGWSQETLAERADLGMRFLQQIEGAKTNVGLNAVVAIANALEATPAALFKPRKLGKTKPGRPKNRKLKGTSSDTYRR